MKIKKILCLLIASLFFLSSCSNKKENIVNDKKSKNNFLAYYNTFFIAEKSFEQALGLIQTKNVNDKNITSQIEKLLDDAIRNSLVIEKDFYRTKYIDDAYYILGMSSYYKNKITAAKYYFQILLDLYPETNYLNNVKIHMSFIDLKIGRINDFESKKSLIELKHLNNEEKYNYYRLMAYYHEIFNDNYNINENYIKSLEYAETKEQRFYIYNKLLKLSELIGSPNLSVEYIEKIQDNIQQFDKDLFYKWIKYKHELGHHNDVSNKLQSLLDDAKTLKDKLFYQIGIAHSDIYLQNYGFAEQRLDDLIEKNASSTVLKNEFSEIYYLLGKINFIKNDFDIAQEKYQLSIDNSRNSEYGKKSQEQISALIEYSNYIEEINYSILLSENKDDEFNFSQNNLDSVYFHLAQIQYFDLDLKDSSINNFKKIINDFPDSKFRNKALIILDIEQPDALWGEMLNDDSEYVENKELNEVDILIDNAWDLLDKKNDNCIKEFKRINQVYDNDKALYITAFIYDYYNYNLIDAMKYYKLYLEKYIDGSFYKTVNDRVKDIKNAYEEEISILEQIVNYRYGFYFLNNQINIDSSKYYFDLASNGRDKTIKLYSKTLEEKANKYLSNIELYSKYINDTLANLDSVRYNLADLLYSYFDCDSLAELYYLEIIKNDNEYKDLSYAALSKIDSIGEWNSLLYEQVSDSIKYNRLLKRVIKANYIPHVKKINLEINMEDLTNITNSYNLLFKDGFDSTKVVLDDLKAINTDTTIIRNNLIKTEADSMKIRIKSEAE